MKSDDQQSPEQQQPAREPHEQPVIEESGCERAHLRHPQHDDAGDDDQPRRLNSNKGHDQVLFFLDDGPDARVGVVGQASLTGESGHNDELSTKRAKAVMNYLTTKKIAASKFQPNEPIALGVVFSINVHSCGEMRT